MASNRRSKLTPERHALIVEAYKRGLWPHQVAAYARVGASTLRLWLQRGRQERRGKYYDLAQDVDAAEADAVASALAGVKRAGFGDKDKPGQWQALAWFLERRHGYVKRAEVTGKDGAPLVVTIDMLASSADIQTALGEDDD